METIRNRKLLTEVHGALVTRENYSRNKRKAALMEVCCFLRHDINFMPAKGEKSFMRQLREKRLLSFSNLLTRPSRSRTEINFLSKNVHKTGVRCSNKTPDNILDNSGKSFAENPKVVYIFHLPMPFFRWPCFNYKVFHPKFFDFFQKEHKNFSDSECFNGKLKANI